MDINLKKTVIHEIGHFIARYLNQKTYNSGFGSMEMIIKKPINSDNESDYRGINIPNRPPNFSDSDEIKDLAEYFAVVVYGCIFESLFLNKKFEDCFNCSGSGNGDIMQYNFNTNRYLNEDSKLKLLLYIKDDYFAEMKDNHVHFNKLFNLEFEHILKNQGSGFSVDLKKLEILILPFIEEHLVYYNSFIFNLRKNIT